MVESVRLVGISASPRKGANTDILVKTAIDASKSYLEREGINLEFELLSLAGKRLLPCTNCQACSQSGDFCVLKDDWRELVHPLIDPVPDGVVFGSPVYFFNQTALGRIYMERCTSLIQKQWNPELPNDPPDFSTTAAGAIAVGFDRNGGMETTMTSVLHWFLIMKFVTVGGFYVGAAGWSGHEDAEKERTAVLGDTIGLNSARVLGRKVASTALLLKLGRSAWEGSLPVPWESSPESE